MPFCYRATDAGRRSLLLGSPELLCVEYFSRVRLGDLAHLDVVDLGPCIIGQPLRIGEVDSISRHDSVSGGPRMAVDLIRNEMDIREYASAVKFASDALRLFGRFGANV